MMGMSDLFHLPVNTNDPWHHQPDLYNKIMNLWNTNTRKVCCQLPTGGGKTRIIRMIVDYYHSSKHVIYVIAHRKKLVSQLSEELTEAGILHGIIQSKKPMLKWRVQICSIQTLKNRLDILPIPDVIIIDEFHHSTSKSFMVALEKWPNAFLLGMTATPQRPDGTPLSDIADALVCGPQPRKLMDIGSLSDYEYFAPDDASAKGLHKKSGDYIDSEQMERLDNRKIIGSAVDHYKKYADHKPAIVCCVNIIHAEHVAEQFKEAGYKARAVHSKQDDRYIDESINGLKSGQVEVLCQVDLLGEGVDIKGAVCLIMLRFTDSIVVFLQQCGRVLRSAPGKDRAIILDHVGNWSRHGLPDDEREWSLDGITKNTGESKYKRCPDCLHPVAKSARVCPHCGHQWTETAEAIERIPEETEGQLVSIKELQRMDRNKLVLEIARKAHNLKQAVLIAKSYGVDNKAAWYIWTKELKNRVKVS
jgi:superfamily II DNA or RNA helicase